jgi:hypothetical protein
MLNYKQTFLFYISITFALFFNVFLDTVFGISLKGYWSDRILFWIWLSVTANLLLQKWHLKPIRIYARVLFVLLLLSLIPFFVPFLGIIITGLGFDRSKNIELKNNIRIQLVNKSIIGRPNLEVIREMYIWEKKIGDMSGFEFDKIEEIKSIKFLHESEDHFYIRFYTNANSLNFILDKP